MAFALRARSQCARTFSMRTSEVRWPTMTVIAASTRSSRERLAITSSILAVFDRRAARARCDSLRAGQTLVSA